MKPRSLLVCLLLAVPVLAPAASKEIQELQRDVALLQQQIKDLQRSQDEKLAAILEAARSSVEAANRANTSVAVITSTIEKNLRDQTDKVATPVPPAHPATAATDCPSACGRSSASAVRRRKGSRRGAHRAAPAPETSRRCAPPSMAPARWQ